MTMKKPCTIDELFFNEVERLRGCGFDPYPECQRLQVPQARDMLSAGLRFYLGDEAKWLPCYDEVAAWLSDNHGRGLLCLGPCGLGKTLIVQNILPVIIHHLYHRVVSIYSAQEMSEQIAKIIKQKFLVVDAPAFSLEAPRFLNCLFNARFSTLFIPIPHLAKEVYHFRMLCTAVYQRSPDEKFQSKNCALPLFHM